MAQSTVEYPKGDAEDRINKALIRILHVDDEADFLKAAKLCLEMQGAFEVETAMSVEEAMEKMKKKTYDVIVSDHVMPRKSGLEFLKELRDSGSSIPFIIFTGKGREEVAIQAMNLGADRYVNKIGNPEVVYGELAYSVHHAVERRRAEERLKEEMENSSRLLEIMPSGLFTVDLDKTITSWNKAAERITGLKEKNVVGKNCVKALNCDRCKQSCGLYSKDVLKPIFGIECILTINGKELPISKNVDYVKDTYGKVIGGVESFVDITKLKKAEKMLRGNEEYLETILNSIFSGVVIIDEETHEIVDANPKALETIGASREHVIGKVCHSFICPAEKGKCPISDLGQTVDKSERVLLRADGERIPILKTVTTTNWKGHKYMIESLIDITERKKSEEVLRESEARYRNLFENSIDVTLTMDLKGTITSINKAAEKYGFKKEGIIGENQLKYVPKKYWPRILKELVQVARGKTVEGEIEINTPKGKKIADYRSNPILIGNKVVGVQVVLRDITERRMTEKELKKSEERFKTMMEEAPIAICNTDLKGKITYVNKRFEEVTGYSREEIVGKSGWKFVSDETSKLLKRRMKERLMGNPSRLQQGQFKSKDGKWIWTEMEGKIIKKFGIPVGFQHIARDITERKRAEKELTETLEKLEAMNEKLGVVGKLTRHDARNKLSTVTMNTFLVKQKLAGDHEALGYLSEIESACEQVERIFDFARVYEMLGAEELIYMDAEKSFKEAVLLFSGLRDIKVVSQCQGLTVLADSLLRQLFYNLIDNSLKHGEKVSQIRVHCEKTGKEQLKLVYEDDGVGISKAEKEKIFKEGYGKGMGYGLYLIRKMCKVYGWTIRETGKHGRGAQFTITIPKKNKEGIEIYKLN